MSHSTGNETRGRRAARIHTAGGPTSSGSGKSTTALAAIGLLPANGRVSNGSIIFDGEDITHASERRIVELRGSSIGMVPQDPMSNLNPVWKIGFQVKETLKANGLPSGA